jgi:hypothetical protein
VQHHPRTERFAFRIPAFPVNPGKVFPRHVFL